MKYAVAITALAGLAVAAPSKSLVQRTSSTNAQSRNPANRSRSSALFGSAPNNRISTSHTDDVTTQDSATSGNWAGAVQVGSGYTSVTGTITVPQVSGNSQDAASAWVGIDGDTCQTAILQTGVSFYADGSFDAWYEWIPDYAYSFDNFGVNVGDQIKMSVDASSTSTGTATLENLTTGQSVTHNFDSGTPSQLCETNAEWIVEAFQSGGNQVSLANFGTVTFSDAYSNGNNAAANSATIINMSPDQQNLVTNCGADGASVSCTYTGP